MKHKITILSLLLLLFTHTQPHDFHMQKPFNKVVLWGHKFHTRHTHGWIHWAFMRAFTHLGYETLWLDNNDNIQNIDFSNTLFITEGQVDQNIPLRDDCRYILHNCSYDKYAELHKNNNCIVLQVYTHRCKQDSVEKVDSCIYQNKAGKIIYMPWATDLLPHEIEANIKIISSIPKINRMAWIGTIGEGLFGNVKELNPFIYTAQSDGVEIITKNHIVLSMQDNIRLVQSSLFAPAIVGTWQLKEGYIPCRIFKNISYGAMGITNSKIVYKLFNKKIIYNEDTKQLYYDAKEKMNNMHIQELIELMNLVKEKHTYLNRIQCLFDFMHIIKPLY